MPFDNDYDDFAPAMEIINQQVNCGEAAIKS